MKMCIHSNCPSNYVDDAFPDFHMLMYADDICIVNDTVGRIQNQLNGLITSCCKYGVNLAKTKVVVFRNGGSLGGNERFYLNNV